MIDNVIRQNKIKMNRKKKTEHQYDFCMIWVSKIQDLTTYLNLKNMYT